MARLALGEVKMKTVEEHLEAMLEDLKRLVPELNRDGLCVQATRCQVIVQHLDEFIETSEIPGPATWPPKVEADRNGSSETHWRVSKPKAARHG